ncbi:phage tail length tape measure family protein, partial [Comamonas sp.]|uniref:phage tail length tape measure family protein n=1 Tax=Comamonas sp. TaxID=34028 RepID=UPI002588782C
MSNDFDARIKVGADTRDAEAGIDRVNSKVASMGDSASKAGAKAGTAFDGMCKSSEGAAAKMDQSTRSAARSMERYVAELQAGSRNTAAYYENMAKQRGADMAALGPYLQQMRLAEKQAEESMKTMGMSAKATAAALRGVPAQFTDIFVSLQGGQAPLTVFLQQGGQLKDMFGGAGNAAKALGSYVLGLVNPYTVAAAAVVGLVAAMAHAESTIRSHQSLMNQLEATGRAGYLNSDAIKQLKADMADLPGISKSMATAIISDLVQVRTLGGEALQKIALMSADFAAATRQDAAGAAKELAKAMEDPAKSARVLDDAFGFLTASQLLAIDAMVEAGNKAGAQEVLLDALQVRLKGVAEDGFTPLQKATDNFGNAWSQAMENVSDAGTLTAANELIGGLVNRVAELVEWLNRARLPEWMKDYTKGGLNGLVFRAIVGDGTPKPEFTGGASGAWGESTGGATGSWGGQSGSQTSELDKEIKQALEATKGYEAKGAAIEKVRGDIGRLSAALKKLRDDSKGDSAEAKALESRLEGANERLKSLTKTSSGYNKELSDQQKLIGKLSGLSSTFYKDWESLNKQYAQGRISLDALEESQAKLLAEQPFAIALAKEEAEVTKARVKAYEDDLKTQDALLKKRQESATKAEEAVQKALEEEEAYGLAASAGITLAEAVAQIAVARAEDAYQQALNRGPDAETLWALHREIDARKKLVEVMGQKGVREANKKAQDQIAKDWEKTSETIGSTLADYIMGGGKDAATYLKRLFATLVLQPVVKYGVQQGMNAIGLGGSGAGGAGGILGGGMPGGSFTDWSSMGANAGDWLMTQSTNLGLNGMQGLGD